MSMTDTSPYSLSGATQPSILRTGWKWIVLITVLLMAVTFYSDKHSHKSYTSTASVVLGSQIFASGAEPLPPDMGTAKTVATSSAKAVQSDVSITNPADTVVLDFAFKATTPALAQRGAEAVAQSFVTYQNSALVAVQKELAAKAVTGRSASTLSVEEASIITNAQLPTKPNGHSLILDLIVALFAGACLGVGVALLVDRASDRLRGVADAEILMERPVLAVVPEPMRHGASRDPVCIIRDDAELRSAYRSLRIRTEIASAEDLGVTVLVTRPHAHGGPAIPTALGLATSLAMSGRQVVLVGSDLTSAPLNKLFGTSGMAGLAEGLRNQENWESALITTSLPGLRLLTEGAETSGAEELFGQKQLSRLFTTLRRSFADVIVIDGPPLLESPESLVFVDVATVVVLDIDGRRTSRSEVRTAMGLLSEHSAAFIGAVMSASPRGMRGARWVLEDGGLTRRSGVGRSKHAVMDVFGPDRPGSKGGATVPLRGKLVAVRPTNQELPISWSDVGSEESAARQRPQDAVLTKEEGWPGAGQPTMGNAVSSISDGPGAVVSRSWIK